MILDLSSGKSIPAAYKDYYIAMLIASRKWRRDLINHWTTRGGSTLQIIDGKTYWGGSFDMYHLNDHPDMVKMADYLGIDDVGKAEISDISGADWTRAYFRSKPKSDNPYTVENVAYMINNGLRPKCIESGLDTVIFKSAYIEVPIVYIDGVADDPMNHIPSAINMKGGLPDSEAFVGLDIFNTTHDSTGDPLVAPLNALGSSGLGNVLGAIYNCTTFFEQFCPHSISVELVSTIDTALHIGSKWVFQTWDTFTMGDYSWMDTNNVTDYLYPALMIGTSKENDYFEFSTFANFKGRFPDTQHIKNLAGYVMDIIDGSITGNRTLYDFVRHSPYEWAILQDGKLWFEYEYVMAMDIKEFAHLLTLHLDIEAGADSGGFFGTFVGRFIGVVLNLVSTIIGAFFKVVELCDVIMKPQIRALLKAFGIKGAKLDRIMAAYEEIRNQITLIIVTLGAGAYFEGVNIAAESSAAMVESSGMALTSAETEMVISGSIEASFASISATQLAKYVVQIGMAGLNAFNAVAETTIDTTEQQEAKESTNATNPMHIVYGGDNNIDFVDAVYIMIDDLGIGNLNSDPISEVYG